MRTLPTHPTENQPPFTCWCGETHNLDTPDPSQAWHNLSHIALAEARIPELVSWFTRLINAVFPQEVAVK